MSFIKILIWFCLIYKISATYNIEFKKFEVLPETDPKFIDFGTTRILKKSRTELEFSGTFYLFKKVTNVGQFTITVFRLNTMGVPQLQVFYSSGGFCDQIAKYIQIYSEAREYSDLPADYCPFPAGNYTFNNMAFQLDELPPMIPSGEYMCSIVYRFNGEIKFGYKLFVVVTNE